MWQNMDVCVVDERGLNWIAAVALQQLNGVAHRHLHARAFIAVNAADQLHLGLIFLDVRMVRDAQYPQR